MSFFAFVSLKLFLCENEASSEHLYPLMHRVALIKKILLMPREQEMMQLKKIFPRAQCTIDMINIDGQLIII